MDQQSPQRGRNNDAKTSANREASPSKFTATKRTYSGVIPRIPGLKIYDGLASPGFDPTIQPQVDDSELEPFPDFDPTDFENFNFDDVPSELAAQSDSAPMSGVTFQLEPATTGAELSAIEAVVKLSGEMIDNLVSNSNRQEYGFGDSRSSWTIPQDEWSPHWSELDPSVFDPPREVISFNNRRRSRVITIEPAILPVRQLAPLEAARQDLDQRLMINPVRRYPTRVPEPITIPQAALSPTRRPTRKDIKTPTEPELAVEPAKRSSPPSKLKNELKLRKNAPSPVIRVGEQLRIWRLEQSADDDFENW